MLIRAAAAVKLQNIYHLILVALSGKSFIFFREGVPFLADTPQTSASPCMYPDSRAAADPWPCPTMFRPKKAFAYK